MVDTMAGLYLNSNQMPRVCSVISPWLYEYQCLALLECPNSDCPPRPGTGLCLHAGFVGSVFRNIFVPF